MPIEVGVDSGKGDDRTVISILTPAAKRTKNRIVEVVSVLIDGKTPDAFDVYIVMAAKERNIPIQKMWDRFCKSAVKKATGHLIERI